MLYWPNPAHKDHTSEAGPPSWNPYKEKCPRMTVAERDALLQASIPVDPRDPRSRRFAVRRTAAGIELFDVKYTEDRGGVPVFHGHPASRVPIEVLREMKSLGSITDAEYSRLRKELPGC